MLLLFLANLSHAREPSYRTEPIVIQVIDLDHADADHLALILRPFLTKDGKIIARSKVHKIRLPIREFEKIAKDVGFKKVKVALKKYLVLEK